MIRFKLFFLTLILSYSSFGQTNQYSEKEVLKIHRLITEKVIDALQNDNPKSILVYFDDNIENLDSKLQQSITKIKKFQSKTKLSDVIVFNEGSHIYRYRYSDDRRARFQVDIYFKTDNPDSKIIGFITKDDQTLKTEYETRMNNSGIPTAPPKND